MSDTNSATETLANSAEALKQSALKTFDISKLEGLIQTAIEMTIAYVPKFLLAIITLIIGLWIIRRVIRLFEKLMSLREMDITLQKFLQSLLSVLLKTLLFISVASMVGIATTSFVAILGAAGLAIGLALQGSLANFAGGVLILMFKPFRAGDYIEGAGVSGSVKEIQIFNTLLTTPDNKRIIVPNGLLSNGTLVNYSSEPTRRVDLVFGISYDDDIEKAKTLLIQLANDDERVLKTPETEVFVNELGASSVDLVLRSWVRSEHYWPFKFAMQERVKLHFDQANIAFPFPQRDVHIVAQTGDLNS